MKNEISHFRNFTATQPGNVYIEQKSTCIALYKCISQVITDLQSCTTERSNIIINDVLPGMLVSTDKNLLTSVTSNLLGTIVMNSQDNTIHISAKLIGNITLIHVRSSNAASNDSIIDAMQKIELLAETLGGCLTISNNRMNGLTLAFTFINH
jgi:hypothetical protein